MLCVAENKCSTLCTRHSHKAQRQSYESQESHETFSEWLCDHCNRRDIAEGCCRNTAWWTCVYRLQYEIKCIILGYLIKVYIICHGHCKMKPVISVFSKHLIYLTLSLKLNYALQITCCLSVCLSVCPSVQVSIHIFSHINFFRITESGPPAYLI